MRTFSVGGECVFAVIRFIRRLDDFKTFVLFSLFGALRIFLISFNDIEPSTFYREIHTAEWTVQSKLCLAVFCFTPTIVFSEPARENLSIHFYWHLFRKLFFTFFIILFSISFMHALSFVYFIMRVKYWLKRAPNRKKRCHYGRR